MTLDRDNARALIAEAKNYEGDNGTARWPALIRDLADALEAALSAVPVEGEVEWGGRIVTASFEDGVDHRFLCGLEACECPDHEGSPLPAGTYITIRLDEDHPVGLRRVTVREVAP